jgi:hypothetical protein
MKHFLLAALALTLLVPATTRAAEEPLVDQVKRAIDEGVRYLKDRQQRENDGKGHWDVELVGRRGGPTCLAMLALLYAGEDPRSDVMQRGLKWLRDLEAVDTYVVGLQTMVFAEARQEEDLLRIQRNVDWLIRARQFNKNHQLTGWGYHQQGGAPDNSNTQYALLGLHAGKSMGVKIPNDVWESIREYYTRTQQADDGWSYRNTPGGSSLTMTTAGLCGLLIAGMELNDAKEKLQPDGSARDCGKYAENDAVAKAMRALTQRFNTEYPPAWFYNLYGLERAGRLSGQRFFGEFDWYRRGCETLVSPNLNRSHRHDDGSWYVRGPNGFDNWPIVSTSFAILFLSKGRTPVLISKLVHFDPLQPNSGWNNKHNDARNVVEYINALKLFKDNSRPQPVAWQIFNARQTGLSKGKELAAELLQTPVAYFNGHSKPVFAGAEEDMLHEYVEQGGFILAEACCGGADGQNGRGFDNGFRNLVKRLWSDEDHQLRKLPDNHPIYTALHQLDPKRDDLPLEGIEFGCKTLVVYSQKPLAGYWEANDLKSPRGDKAFKLAANIVAYATGLELPKPRGTEIEIFADKPESEQKRGFLKIAQLKHDGDRFSAGGVTRNLMRHLQQKLGVDVAVQTQDMQLGDKDLLNYKFLYMHGRGDFHFGERELRLLKANLSDGGVLFADACCGKKPFDESFRKMVKQLFGSDLEPIPPDDDLFSSALNGAAIARVKCRREAGKGYEVVAPALEGIKVKIDDKHFRWAVIYSKYDIGCALEKHQSTDCLGHDYESALRLSTAAVLYALQR